MFDTLAQLDRSLFTVINNLTFLEPLNPILIFIAEYYPFLMIAALLFFSAMTLKANKRFVLRQLVQIIFAIQVAQLVKTLIANFFFKPRPFVYNAVNVILEQFPENSAFPSGHTYTAFAVATIAYIQHKKFGILLYFFAFIGSFLRIYGGVHYPLDILGGIVFGVISALLTHVAFEYIEKHRHHE